MSNRATICFCWKAAPVSKRDQEELRFFENYFESKKNLAAFPFVIFHDHLPGKSELVEIMTMQDVYQKQKPFILVLRKQDTHDHAACWNLLEAGIDDIIEWTDTEEIVCYLESRYERSNTIRDTLECSLVQETLIGESTVWKTFLHDIIETTLFSQASILLIGESGTGKELISNLIHLLDKRSDKKKLVVVDCTTIVAELSGSELFGHERGSYTNAIQGREGAVALANGGTLFLDEIGELPLNLQAELLRVLQEGSYKKVGSNNWQKTSFRLICATHRNLQADVENGRFRHDLFFRISDCQFTVPSLEQRRDDIPALVNHFLSKLFKDKDRPELDFPVIQQLMRRNYPGNVRELRQVVQRLALKHVEHKKITVGEVPLRDRYVFATAENTGVSIDSIDSLIRKALLTGENWWNLKNRISETAILIALELENNNKQKAAERLGVDVRTVQQYVKKKASE